MRILFRSIIALSLVFSLLIFGAIWIARQEERWCYQMQSFEDPLVWYWFDVQAGTVVMIGDPIMTDDGIQTSAMNPFTDFVQQALYFHPQLNSSAHDHELYYDTPISPNDVFWTSDGRYMAYLTHDGMLYLKNAIGNTLQSRQIDPLGSNSYAIYAFTLDGQYLIYYNQQEIHLLTVPDLQPAPFSPIDPDLPTVIDWSPSGDILLAYNAQQILFYHQNHWRIFPNDREKLLDFRWRADEQAIATYHQDLESDLGTGTLHIYTLQSEIKTVATDEIHL